MMHMLLGFTSVLVVGFSAAAWFHPVFIVPLCLVLGINSVLVYRKFQEVDRLAEMEQRLLGLEQKVTGISMASHLKRPSAL